jgi:lipopolysaccharide biosynthesis glycosyltransferase
MLKIFIGVDPRQAVSVATLASSIYRQSSKPVSITPLILSQLPLQRKGLTEFTYSRFLCPYLCNYEGWSLFLDADMLLKTDITELFALADDKYDIMVCKNPHKFEWASVMLFNNAKCRVLTPEYIETADGLHGISWTKNIGELPLEWNHLVGYDAPRPDAKLVHYTQGNPIWEETRACEYGDDWWFEYGIMADASESWETIMGNSVHAVNIVEGNKTKLLPKFYFDIQYNGNEIASLKPKKEYLERLKELFNDEYSTNSDK